MFTAAVLSSPTVGSAADAPPAGAANAGMASAAANPACRSSLFIQSPMAFAGCGNPVTAIDQTQAMTNRLIRRVHRFLREIK
jgi:hypothetical protein